MPPDFIDQIRQALVERVRTMGSTYYTVANYCEIDPASLYRFRDGKQNLSAAALNRLAFYLDLKVVSSGDAQQEENGG